LAAAVQALAAEKGCTAGQVALAWVLAQGDDIVPIPGTKRVRYLEENVGALAVVLSAAERGRLEAAFPRGAASGERYSAQSMKSIDR
jgi:aryl-alcohol dehydrogenase-like predicted oxidoreductase